MVNKYSYIFQPVQTECRVQYLADEMTSSSLIVLFPLSIIARVVVYFQTNNLLQKSERAAAANLATYFSTSIDYSAPGTVLAVAALSPAVAAASTLFAPNTPASAQVVVDLYDLDEEAISAIRNRKSKIEVRGTRLGRETIRKLKKGNTQTMVAGMLSLLVIAFYTNI